MTKHIVTAIDANKGYRVTISDKMSLTRARYFEKTVTRNMLLAIPAYQQFSDIQIKEAKQ